MLSNFKLWGAGISTKPSEVPKALEITQTSPFGQSEGHEKYSAEGSAAINSSSPLETIETESYLLTKKANKS